jgi:hypothetical protein
MFMTSLARRGGGYLYDTGLLGDDNRQVCLVYVHPPLSGVVIGAVAPISTIQYPVPPVRPETLKERVHSAVTQALLDETGDIIVPLDDDDRYDPEIALPLNTFDYGWTAKPDRYGMVNSTSLFAAADGGGGYLWALNDPGTDVQGLTLAYAELVDDNWGIWSYMSGNEEDDVVMMVDVQDSIV